MEYTQLTLNTNLFSMGNLLGSTGAPELMKKISSMAGYGSNHFGTVADPFRDHFQNFMSVVVEPIRQVQVQLQQAGVTVHKEDKIRCIDTVEKLQEGFPPCMIKAILTFPPIRKLAEDGRIDAWGIDVNTFPDEDEYGRLISNGRVDLIPGNIKDGEVTLLYEWCSLDPIVSLDELEDIEETRMFLAAFLEDEDTKNIDPTAVPYGQLRG